MLYTALDGKNAAFIIHLYFFVPGMNLLTKKTPATEKTETPQNQSRGVSIK